MPKLRDEVDRMEIAVLAVVFLARIFHFRFLLSSASGMRSIRA